MPKNQVPEDAEIPNVEWGRLLIMLMAKNRTEEVRITADDINYAMQYGEVTVRPSMDANELILELHKREDRPDSIIIHGEFRQ